MRPLRLWMIMCLLTGGLTGYIVASGIGVVFAGASALPLVGRIWWVPIPMFLFLLVFRLLFHEELHSPIKGQKEAK